MSEKNTIGENTQHQNIKMIFVMKIVVLAKNVFIGIIVNLHENIIGIINMVKCNCINNFKSF